MKPKTTHKPKKTSAPKPAARGSKATPPKKPAAKTIDKKPSKKGASKNPVTATPSEPSATEVERGAREIERKIAERLDAPRATPPAETKAPVVIVDNEEVSIPGEAIAGPHLVKCIRYAGKVTPKEDGEIVFTHDNTGRALISGHDQRRCHTGFLVVGAAMCCDISVPRDDAMEFASAIEGLSGALVRIGADGVAVVHHGIAQPPMRFLLGARPITQKWQPPEQGDRVQSVGPLRIPAAAQSAAVKWPAAVMQSWQSRDGIEWITVTDQETGELLARAVLAQEGRDLYPEDQRQTEIPGSRTAGAPDGASRLPPVTVLPPVEKQPELFDTAPAAPREGAVTIEAGGEAVTIEADAKPAEPPVEPAQAPPPFEAQAVVPAWPEPGDKPIVVEIPDVLFDELSSEAIDALRLPPGVTAPIFWFNTPDHRASPTLTADSARAVGAECTALGLCCEDVSAGRRHGIEVTVWTVGRAGEKGAAQ